MPNMFINLQECYVYDQNFHGGRDGGCVVGNFAALLLSFLRYCFAYHVIIILIIMCS